MIFPPVYRTLRTPAVMALVDDRIGRHGEVAQDERRPYITYSIVVGNPYDRISGTPCADFTAIDVNCWHPEDSGVEALALAVVAALDAAGHANRVRVNNRDPATRLYRVGIEADFITQR